MIRAHLNPTPHRLLKFQNQQLSANPRKIPQGHSPSPNRTIWSLHRTPRRSINPLQGRGSSKIFAPPRTLKSVPSASNPTAKSPDALLAEIRASVLGVENSCTSGG